MQPGPDRSDEWTPESFPGRLYRTGYEHAARRLREGLDIDAIRAGFARLAEGMGRPFGPDATRGIDDALTGRPCSP